ALDATYGADGNDVQLSVGGVTQAENGTTTVLLQRGALTLSGTPAQHSLRADLAAPDDVLLVDVQGAFADGDWRGTIQRAALDSRAGDWQLEAPTAVTYVGGGLTLAQNCWRYAQTRVCLQGGMPAGLGID